jgi:hypothetical protein
MNDCTKLRIALVASILRDMQMTELAHTKSSLPNTLERGVSELPAFEPLVQIRRADDTTHSLGSCHRAPFGPSAGDRVISAGYD